jgi:hypothetical protein
MAVGARQGRKLLRSVAAMAAAGPYVRGRDRPRSGWAAGPRAVRVVLRIVPSPPPGRRSSSFRACRTGPPSAYSRRREIDSVTLPHPIASAVAVSGPPYGPLHGRCLARAAEADRRTGSSDRAEADRRAARPRRPAAPARRREIPTVDRPDPTRATPGPGRPLPCKGPPTMIRKPEPPSAAPPVDGSPAEKPDVGSPSRPHIKQSRPAPPGRWWDARVTQKSRRPEPAKPVPPSHPGDGAPAGDRPVVGRRPRTSRPADAGDGS